MFRVSGSGFLVPDKPSALRVFRSAFCLSLRTGIEGSAPGTRNSNPEPEPALRALLPFNRARGFTGDIIADPVYAFHFVNDPRRDPR